MQQKHTVNQVIGPTGDSKTKIMIEIVSDGAMDAGFMI